MMRGTVENKVGIDGRAPGGGQGHGSLPGKEPAGQAVDHQRQEQAADDGAQQPEGQGVDAKKPIDGGQYRGNRGRTSGRWASRPG